MNHSEANNAISCFHSFSLRIICVLNPINKMDEQFFQPFPWKAAMQKWDCFVNVYAFTRWSQSSQTCIQNTKHKSNLYWLWWRAINRSSPHHSRHIADLNRCFVLQTAACEVHEQAVSDDSIDAVLRAEENKNFAEVPTLKREGDPQKRRQILITSIQLPKMYNSSTQSAQSVFSLAAEGRRCVL